MAINFKHQQTGLIKECPEGFSWTTLFFGFWPAIIRGMWGQAAIQFFTMGLASFYYIFTLNKAYAVKLLEQGYQPAGELDQDKVKALGIFSPPNIDIAPQESVDQHQHAS